MLCLAQGLERKQVGFGSRREKGQGLRKAQRFRVRVGVRLDARSLTGGGSRGSRRSGCAKSPGRTKKYIIFNRCRREPRAAKRSCEGRRSVEHVAHVGHARHVPLREVTIKR